MKEPSLHRGILSRFRWDDPLLVVCSLVFEFLALGLGLVWTLALLGPEFLSVWYLAGASTFAFLCACLAVAAWRGSHRARSIAIGFPGLLAVSAPMILFLGGSVWFDGAQVREGMTPREVLGIMEDQWLYHWPLPQHGPEATRVSELLRSDALPLWSSPATRSYSFTDDPPSADVVDVVFDEQNTVVDVTYGAD